MAEEKIKEQENKKEPTTVAEGNLPEAPDFRVGDTIRVIYKIIEGQEVRRTQPYEGIVIAKKGSGISKTFTVRRIGAEGVGVERIFPLYSPNIESVEVVKKGKVRRAKLFYLRGKTGREAMRIKERKDKK
jgi:large subunit ribosomal protein L19